MMKKRLQFTGLIVLVFSVVSCGTSRQKHSDENSILKEVSVNKTGLEEGKRLFADNCSVCHGANGEGEIGPNLTDDYWFYGSTHEDIATIIHDGTLKGMPNHETKLTLGQISNLASFILSLPEKSGKSPEGKKVK